MSLNSVTLMGRLTADPELKNTNSGLSVTSFCIAVDRKYSPKGEEKKADFIDCVAWRNTAEFICKYFKKGSLIGIEGEIQTRTYTDNSGNNRKATEILINNASFCESKAAGNNQGGASEPPYIPDYGMTKSTSFEDLPHDDTLPF